MTGNRETNDTIDGINAEQKIADLEEFELIEGKHIHSSSKTGMKARINKNGWYVIRTQCSYLIAAKHIDSDSSWYVTHPLPFRSTPRGQHVLVNRAIVESVRGELTTKKRVPSDWLDSQISMSRGGKKRKRKMLTALHIVLQAHPICFDLDTGGGPLFNSQWFDVIGMDQSDDMYEVMQGFFKCGNDKAPHNIEVSTSHSYITTLLKALAKDGRWSLLSSAPGGDYNRKQVQCIMNDRASYKLRLVKRKTTSGIKVENLG